MSDQHNKEIDKVTGVETTGHEWDGLRELNNPAPRWWIWVWIVSIIWSVGYWVVYPAWPTLSQDNQGGTEGSFGWTQYKELEASQAEIVARQAQYLAKFETASYDQIASDPELNAFAMAGGNALFKNNCATCHGSGGQGAKGYPNLTDNDWMWGGQLADIEQTIRYGIRSGHDEARQSQMPAFGKDELLDKAEIDSVVDYVLSMSSDEGPDASSVGAEVFANNCASCHGEKGTGGRDFGAPNLTDAIWLYGGDRETVYQTVYNARSGLMPYWEGKLDENAIRELTVYVHGLGGGEGVGAAVVEEEQAAVEQVAPVEDAETVTSEDAPATESDVDASAEPSVEEGVNEKAAPDDTAAE
ncbi:MAG: cytochrome-c oxidase, cbb3-type subunit III [Pseudobdellovibrionaceae bacterium]|jgi:cytochrome c oxidase cbb3-type subunit 3|nr:cytochrome-c oxidase, cbb3-type subunit III [Pseudobdellovibrionaceae bacterium]